MNPDILNAGFEGIGALLAWRNAYQLYKDQAVKGIYWPIYFFYTGWGAWNCLYYPAIGQMWSFYAGVVLCLGNFLWISIAVRLWWQRRHAS